MSRDISVVRAVDLEFITTPPDHPVDSPEFDAWCHESLQRHLFSEPLGSESSIRVFWSEPAVKRGLHLLASMYDDGFHEACIWSGEHLDLLEKELTILEEAWRHMVMPPAFLGELRERSAAFRQAIEVARENQGVILVT